MRKTESSVQAQICTAWSFLSDGKRSSNGSAFSAMVLTGVSGLEIVMVLAAPPCHASMPSRGERVIWFGAGEELLAEADGQGLGLALEVGGAGGRAMCRERKSGAQGERGRP